MFVDFKIITWERVQVSEDDIEAIKSKLESGEIETANELVEAFDDSTYEGTVDEMDSMVSVEANGGWATIEMREKGQDPIFVNGKV